jgi:ppGpp synthetase/RelA/SpoT-type nucleotidyltranferase
LSVPRQPWTLEVFVPSTDFERAKADFRSYYDDNLKLLQGAAKDFRSLVEKIILQNQIEIDKVTARVKDRDGCIEKFDRKYRATLESQDRPYEIKGFISDLVGVRVVCLYEPDVKKVEKILRGHLDCLAETDKTAEIEEQESSFGYKGLHLDVKLRQAHVEHHPPFREYKDIQFELQIRTISQDAWSTIDHRIKYKKNIPRQLGRRINRLAALFELADQEFVNIRDAANAELTRGEKIAQAAREELARGEKGHKDLEPLDVFSFLGVAKSQFPEGDFVEKVSDEFLQAVKQMDPKLTAKDLSDALTQHLPKIEKYQTDNKIHLKPFTKIRYALFLRDADKFGPLLLPSQHKVFDPWLEKQNFKSQSEPTKPQVKKRAVHIA